MKLNLLHKNLLLVIVGFAIVIVLVVLIGLLSLSRDPDIIQGQVEVTEYRISSKVPGRILEIRVKEGDFVKAGDTLAILDAPELRAKMEQARGAEGAAAAVELKAHNGARREQIQGAFEILQQAKTGYEIAEKSYNRIQALFDEGVVSAQKRDEAYANYRAMEAQMKAAQSQYDMAVNGARMEERLAAQAQTARARGAIQEVNSYLHETVQTAPRDGEVSELFPKVGELVGNGTPIMTISVMDDLWGTFSVREDHLKTMQEGMEFTAFVPAFNKDIRMRVTHTKDQASYAAWKATKASGRYDQKIFEVKARPVEPLEGLRPGMSLIIR